MLISNSAQSILPYLEVHGYIIMFILMVIEGPIVNAAASFAASLGYFNIIIVWILAFLGDFTADMAYFAIGRFGHHFVIKRYKYLFKERAKLIHQIRKGLANHAIKTILFVKLTPFLAGIGLMLVGLSKISFKRYIKITLLTILPITLTFSVVGFFFGKAVFVLLKYFELGKYAILFVGVIIIIAYAIYRYILIGVIKPKFYLK